MLTIFVFNSQSKKATFAQQWKCTKYVLATHFSVELPQVSIHLGYSSLRTPRSPVADWSLLAPIRFTCFTRSRLRSG